MARLKMRVERNREDKNGKLIISMTEDMEEYVIPRLKQEAEMIIPVLQAKVNRAPGFVVYVIKLDEEQTDQWLSNLIKYHAIKTTETNKPSLN